MKVDKAEKERARSERHSQKAEKALNHRKTKNFLFILTGILCAFAILAGGIAIGLTVVPTKTYLGENQQVFTEEYAEKPPISLINSLNKAYIDDIIVLKEALVNFTQKEEIAKYVTLDEEKLNSILLFDIGSRLGECLIISADNVPISDFIKDEFVVKIMREGCNLSSDTPVKVGDLKNFNIGKVKIHTMLSVLKEDEIKGSKLLYAIYKDEATTVNELPNKINSLKLSEVYEKDCFIEDGTGTSPKTAKYKPEYDDKGNVLKYIQDVSGTYYISKNSSFWFFMLFSPDEGATFDENGNCSAYVITDATFGQLDTMITTTSKSIQDATIGQLYDTGFLVNDRPNIRKFKLEKALPTEIIE